MEGRTSGVLCVAVVFVASTILGSKIELTPNTVHEGSHFVITCNESANDIFSLSIIQQKWQDGEQLSQQTLANFGYVIKTSSGHAQWQNANPSFRARADLLPGDFSANFASFHINVTESACYDSAVYVCSSSTGLETTNENATMMITPLTKIQKISGGTPCQWNDQMCQQAGCDTTTPLRLPLALTCSAISDAHDHAVNFRWYQSTNQMTLDRMLGVLNETTISANQSDIYTGCNIVNQSNQLRFYPSGFDRVFVFTCVVGVGGKETVITMETSRNITVCVTGEVPDVWSSSTGHNTTSVMHTTAPPCMGEMCISGCRQRHITGALLVLMLGLLLFALGW